MFLLINSRDCLFCNRKQVHNILTQTTTEAVNKIKTVPKKTSPHLMTPRNIIWQNQPIAVFDHQFKATAFHQNIAPSH